MKQANETNQKSKNYFINLFSFAILILIIPLFVSGFIWSYSNGIISRNNFQVLCVLLSVYGAIISFYHSRFFKDRRK